MSLTYRSSEWYITCTILVTGAYSEPRQISKIELFSRIVHLFQPLSIFAKDSNIIVCLYTVGREWGFLLWPTAKCCYYFYKIIAAQMDGKAGVLFPLRVVRLMCTRFLTVSRVCIKGSSSLKTVGETYSEVQYLSSERAVGMASARRIV